jgi:hypothetical protein
MQWHGERLLSQLNRNLETVTHKTAVRIMMLARQNLMSNDSVQSGDLIRALKVKKSKFKNGGHIVGVFGSRSDKWENTIGGRAVFVEFGHAKPNDARGAKVTEEKPFFTPAVDIAKREFKRAVRKLL